MPETPKPWVRNLPPTGEVRTSMLEVLKEHCLSLPEGVNHTITIELEEENRRTAQNSLMWAWNAEAGKAQGYNANYQHGLWKYMILLPMQRGWKNTEKRAAKVQDILDEIDSFNNKVFYCFDAVRTRKGLTVKQMAEALTEYKRFYEEQGIMLRSRQDLINEAIGDQQ